MKVRKAVIPVAGIGTRFLPAAKAQPKEMLVVVDKPVIQYIVEECIASGIKDILFVTSEGKESILNHFDKNFRLESVLEKKGKTDLLEMIKGLSEGINIHTVRQKEQLGLGHAVGCAKEFVGNEPFALLLGDTIIDTKTPCTKDLIEVYDKHKCSVLAAVKVPREVVNRYGIFKLKDPEGRVYEVEDMVEKPDIDKAPSNMSVATRYILTPEIFEMIEKTKPGHGGEIQITDAIKLLLEKQKVYAYEIDGEKMDIGNKLEFVKANIKFALRRDDMKNEIKEFIKDLEIR
ncbi:MAG: UTP--glucose-1-phosphate uridylyltransferase GalU [Candidatus Aenigmarchaeota archaeon]|nr:UTP--glucose-1-phosphate uridylyltransferase GalU [Candidatus Aenigmarchaeota archaeon]